MGSREAAAGRAGCLYVVATPIGNLEDVTARAARILGEVDWVACEDTRRTRILLGHLGLQCRLIPLWQGNEPGRSAQLLERLKAGEQGALVSDGGTPLLSDPGFLLVREARAAGVPVVPVPGPCAAVAALSAAGLPATPFFFMGFPPRSPGRLRKRLAGLRELPATLVLYESPERAAATLRVAREALGEREAVCARELTKLHEEFLAGTLGELAEQLEQHPPRGEVTLVIAGAVAGDGSDAAETAEEGAAGGAGQEAALEQAMRQELAQGASPRDAARAVAARCGVARREAYAVANRLIAEEAGARATGDEEGEGEGEDEGEGEGEDEDEGEGEGEHEG